MKQKDAFAEELASLRADVETLRQQQQATSKKPPPKANQKPNKTHQAECDLEKDTHDLLTNILEHAKHDYDKLSPASALVLFSLGALFGSILSRRRGGKS
jgi:hypothetical protein